MGLFDKFFAKKQSAINSNHDFWQWFQLNEKAFFKAVAQGDNIQELFFSKLSPKLEELKSGFFFLTGMFNTTTAELVLTADGNVNNIAFVEDLVACAPVINGWKFTALKQEHAIENTSIKMAGYVFDDNTLSFYANVDEDYPDEIAITIVHNDFNEDCRLEIINGTYLFLDHYLGELNFAVTIDVLEFVQKSDATAELVPIEKLKSFLKWREKEFIEKYDGVRHNTENDSYSLFEANAEQENYVIATMDTDLLSWDAKASHPWIGIVTLKYDETGMPNEAASALLYEIEEQLLAELKDVDGYLYIGHETTQGTREIYLACNDFRKPSKVFYTVKEKYSGRITIATDIYKDKYWKSFNRFIDG